MSATTTDVAGRSGAEVRHGEGFLTTLGRWFVRGMDLQARTDEIARLQALSDSELAARGIARERIVHHVFRDKLGG